MNKHLLRGATFLLLSAVFAQTMLSAPQTADAQIISAYAPQQLAQLAAPVALYPDPLLGEVLMASTYPQEVVAAAQWRDANPGISGDYLTDALEQQPWDPSVKGLTEFPQVLDMMNSNLEWTENLGEAFLADQQGVMNAVQGLRQQAQASGELSSDQQETVSDQDGDILIQPTDPALVYVPYYNPAAVFSPWPYPNYTPYAFTAPSCVVYVNNGLFGYCTTGIAVVYALWGWDSWDWHDYRISIDNRRWSDLNNAQPLAVSGVWGYDPDHRHNVPYKDAAVRAHFENTPASTLRPYRGYDDPSQGYDKAGVASSGAVTGRQGRAAAEEQPRSPLPMAQRGAMPAGIRQPETRAPEMRQPEMRAPAAAPPLFESFASGAQARTEAARGNVSTPRPAPEAASPPPEKNNAPDQSRKDERR